ncbi:carboxypeptidase inhibitor SmCI-like [Ruditapes philippinarum]|uniref:carboxypeptidase inhibitor SmCI-like n=1 Tax=Ruditapes philippinarum TaxID=129788 RepID=UPI00295AC7ED|nr:carboxypeptidase inhibitor SmCI-like [Ruditapes philippinarum]
MGRLHFNLAALCCVQLMSSITAQQVNNIRDGPGQNQRQAPECTLTKEVGNCNDQVKKFYFDITTGTCREFIYSGCGGNLNNFLNIERCNSRCVCWNKKSAGRGTGRETRYFYNKETERCESFFYKGAGGNINRFRTLQECQGMCERATLRYICSRRPEFGTDCNNNSTIQFYYDKRSDTCRKFTYLGCGGNRNRFPSNKVCKQVCYFYDGPRPTVPPQPTRSTITTTTQPRPQPPRVCLSSPDAGFCIFSFDRYYYDTITRTCKRFAYSGCGGNANRFLSKRLCERTCVYL